MHRDFGHGMHHMSMGQYQMINRILSYDDTYTIEQLSDYSMALLRELYQKCMREHNEEPHQGHDSHHE